MIKRAVCVLLLAASVAALPGVAVAGTWEGPFPCAPWYSYYLWGRSWYQRWNFSSSDVVAVAGSTTGVTTEALRTASVTAAQQWKSRVYGLPYLNFVQSGDLTQSSVRFLSHAAWIAKGLNPTAMAAQAVTSTYSDSTIRHVEILLHIRPDRGWCTDCEPDPYECYTYNLFDLPTILAHEFGHCWRVGDGEDPECFGDLMYAWVGPGYVIRTPSAMDVESVQYLYMQPVDALAALYRSEASPDSVVLIWSVSGTAPSAVVERSSPTVPWSALKTVFVDGTGYLHCADATVAPGTRYGYRLRISGAEGDVLVGETWVDVPGRTGDVAFALASVSPNPSHGSAPTVRFTLPSAATASLEVLDVSGRRIAAREVGSLGAGEHALGLEEGGHLAPGFYLVRLTQGANTRTTRMAVTR
jgi:hypothetical protein